MREPGPAIWIYIVTCSDGSYYTGSHRGPDIRTRIAEHNGRKFANAYTGKRLPVVLVWAAPAETITEAVAFERQIKGWSRAKKEALIRGDYDALPGLSRSRSQPNEPTSS